MKKFLLFLFVVVTTPLSAQFTDAEAKIRTQNADTVNGWKKGGIASITFAQSAYYNWAAGGQNSVTANALISVFANYKKNNTSWDNNFDIAYGSLLQGKDLSKASMIKTDDKVELNSKYGKKAFNNWYYAMLLNFKTQMAPGYNYPNDSVKISDFMSPAYVLLALGMDYKPNDNFSFFIAPITGKMTCVADQKLADGGAFGVEAAEYDTLGNKLSDGKIIRMELGGYMRMVYKKEIVKNITLSTKLDLFSNYLENLGNIDVGWETLISMKVNKFITATINTHLIYDHDIDIVVDDNNDGIVDAVGPRTQFKEVFGLAFSYKF